jgi:prepilin-type N-terminal cleavage/methylation domain-containing protein
VRGENGFSLMETLIAVAVLGVGFGTVAELALMATRASQRSRDESVLAIIGHGKLEELRSLALAGDGRALIPSPAEALASNVGGYCDFLDVHGRVLQGTMTEPTGTQYVRRWSIRAIAHHSDLFLVQVAVFSRRGGRVHHAGIAARKEPGG